MRHLEKSILAFHGTDRKFKKFNTSGSPTLSHGFFSLGSHFGTHKAANDILKYNTDSRKRIIAALLNFENTLRLDDTFASKDSIYETYKQLSDIFGDTGRSAPFIRQLKSIAERSITNKISRRGRTFNESFAVMQGIANSLIRKAIIAEGYDSIVYKNRAEDIGSDSYIALHEDQIKQLGNGMFTGNPDALNKHARKFNAIKNIDPLAKKIKGIRRQQRPTRKYFEDLFTDKETGEIDRDKAELYFGEAADAYAKKSFYGTRDNQDPLDYMYGPRDNWVGYDPSSSPIGDLFRRQASEEDLIRSTNDRKERIRSHRNFVKKYKRLSNYEREVLNRTVEYGGGAEAHAWAEEDITDERNDKAESLRRRRRLYAAKRDQKANEAYRYDMMDEFDQKMHDLTERYGGDKGKADASLRNILKKELGPFFKNSRMSTKDLHGLYKNINKIGKIPIVGGLAKSAMLNPYTAAATLGIMFADSRISVAKEVNDWRNTESVFGRPDAKLARQMKNAGVGDEGAILKKYSATASWLADLRTNGEAWNVIGDVMVASMGKMDLSGVNPFMSVEDLAQIIAPQFARLDKQSKIATLRALSRIGVDENVIKSWEFYAGTELPDSSYKAVGGTQEIIDTAKKITNENPFNIDAWLHRLRPIAYLEYLLSGDYYFSPAGERMRNFAKHIGLPVDQMFKQQESAESIAQQDITYQQYRAANPSYYDYVTNNNSEKTTSIHIDTAEFNGIQNVGEFKDEMESMADRASERHAAAEMYDPKMR